jgi:hypothetical protein
MLQRRVDGSLDINENLQANAPKFLTPGRDLALRCAGVFDGRNPGVAYPREFANGALPCELMKIWLCGVSKLTRRGMRRFCAVQN